MVFVVFLNVKIHRALALVGIATVHNLLHQLYLFYDVTGGMRLYAWRQHTQRLHGLVIAVGVILCHLHRLQLLQSCFLGYLVIALIGIVLQVPHVGNVSHVAHLIAYVLQIPEQDVESDGRTGMTQMGVSINGGTTYIHAHIGSMKRLKRLLAAAERIVNE